MHKFAGVSRLRKFRRDDILSKKFSTNINTSSIPRLNFDLTSTYFSSNLDNSAASPPKSSHSNFSQFKNDKYVIMVNILDPAPTRRISSSFAPDTSDSMRFLDEPRNELYEKQINMEHQQHDMAVNDYMNGLQSLLKIGKGTGVQHFGKIILSWFEPFVLDIAREVEFVRNNVAGVDRTCYGPCLLLLEPEKLAVITLNTTLNSILRTGNAGVKIASLTKEIGEAIQTEISLQKIQNSKKGLSKNIQKKFLKDGNNRRRRPGLTKKILYFANEEEWPSAQKVKVGAALITLLKEVAKTPRGTYAFEHKMERVEGTVKTNGILKLDNKYFEEISMKDLTNLSPRYLPMVVPPKRWDNKAMSGGYFSLKTTLIRTYSRLQLKTVRDADMEPVLRGLDYLGSLPWRINQSVLSILKEAWTGGESIGDLPPINNLPAPSESDYMRVQTTEPGQDSVPVLDEAAFTEMCRRVKKKNSEYHSLRADLHLKLWVADQFLDQDMYFPHNLDFRGRAYPVPPNLSHMGSDTCRGILTFARAKPWGKVGLYWVKVHLANLFGHNKVSFGDRVSWVESNWELVMDSGENPLCGKRFWITAEDPFQALAVCIELHRAHINHKNPELHESRVPVHMDGSCNGLQHYAALGKDPSGAVAVNLTPSDRPQDVYSAVLAIVLSRMDRDRAVPPDAPNEADRLRGELSRLLEGKVDRRVVKQTVMTSVYGVTTMGARAQIQDKLLTKFLTGGKEILTPEAENAVFKASLYLAMLTLESLGEMFCSAKNIMDWLASCAKIVATQGHSMSWVTPLGLPAIQPYRQPNIFLVKTLLQSITLAEHSDQLPVSMTKQRSAFPPNYVHSLDSTHMLITSLKMRDRGLDFASVHDSYWTHAADVPVMGELIRESFVELYEQPLLEDLYDSLRVRFPAVEFPEVPERGTFDIQAVKDSKYFFH